MSGQQSEAVADDVEVLQSASHNIWGESQSCDEAECHCAGSAQCGSRAAEDVLTLRTEKNKNPRDRRLAPPGMCYKCKVNPISHNYTVKACDGCLLRYLGGHLISLLRSSGAEGQRACLVVDAEPLESAEAATVLTWLLTNPAISNVRPSSRPEVAWLVCWRTIPAKIQEAFPEARIVQCCQLEGVEEWIEGGESEDKQWLLRRVASLLCEVAGLSIVLTPDNMADITAGLLSNIFSGSITAGMEEGSIVKRFSLDPGCHRDVAPAVREIRCFAKILPTEIAAARTLMIANQASSAVTETQSSALLRANGAFLPSRHTRATLPSVLADFVAELAAECPNVLSNACRAADRSAAAISGEQSATARSAGQQTLAKDGCVETDPSADLAVDSNDLRQWCWLCGRLVDDLFGLVGSEVPSFILEKLAAAGPGAGGGKNQANEATTASITMENVPVCFDCQRRWPNELLATAPTDIWRCQLSEWTKTITAAL